MIDNNQIKEKITRFDLHTHHERCGHAIGTVEDYIRAAIESGLHAVGISDHSPFFAYPDVHPHPGSAMAACEFEAYISEVLLLKKKYEGKIDVLLGVESDFFPEHQELYRDWYRRFPFDYILGSVHYLNGTHIFERKRWLDRDEQELIHEQKLYYSLIQQAARSGLFDIIGHLDAIKGYYPSGRPLLGEHPDDTLQVIAQCGLAIEVNTSGLYKDCREWYPSPELLERAYHYGVPVTFGSDAHEPGRVGDRFDSVRERLKQCGYREWYVFKNRRKYAASL